MIKINQLFVLFIIVFYNGCVEDPIDSVSKFDGPSEIKVDIQTGTFSGTSFSLFSLSSSTDHKFIVTDKINKILCQPLQNRGHINLKSSSFINWAWIGDTVTGNFAAIFATDTNVTISGNIQLQYVNDDELNTSIPKGTPIQIFRYDNPDGAIEGQFEFNAPLDYKLDGISKRESSNFKVQFKIKRGNNI